MRATYHSLMNTIILNNHVNLKLGVGGGGGERWPYFILILKRECSFNTPGSLL